MGSNEDRTRSSSTGDRRRSALLADKGLLILVAIACSVVVGGMCWAVKSFGVSSGTVTIVILSVMWIESRIRIRELERKLKENGIEAPIFPVRPRAPPS